jgi:GH15 family glucan-1,4-alpha-glucosidase
MLRHFGSYVCRHWSEPDNGMWEPRVPPQHYTHSRLMCWVALDRLLDLQKRGLIDSLPVEKLQQHRDDIRADIMQRAWNENMQCYTQTLDGDTLDATVLLLALHGFEDYTSTRMQRTCRGLRDILGAGPGLLYRYEQSRGGREGAFAICGFWLAEFLARGGGSLDEAHETMEALLIHANDVGLFAEEIDAFSGNALGNFPQAFTHIGLINAALAIEEREKQEPRSEISGQRSVSRSAAAPADL